MVEEFGELDEGEFALAFGGGEFEDLPAESLAERVGGEVLDLDVVAALDFLQEDVDPLGGVDAVLVREEAWPLERPRMDGVVAGLDVGLELLVDLDGPALVRLLLVDDELSFGVEKVFPRQGQEVADAESEEDSAADEERHCVLFFAIEFADECRCSVEVQIV